jgi:hypothetical protein
LDCGGVLLESFELEMPNQRITASTMNEYECQLIQHRPLLLEDYSSNADASIGRIKTISLSIGLA